MSRSCVSLGMCQSRKPACDGCTWQLAPGVIDGPHHRKPARKSWAATIGTALLAAALLASLALTIGLASGYLTAGGVIP